MAENQLSFFGIELGVDGKKVLAGLERLEKKSLQSANRIEKTMNRAFERAGVNGLRQMNKMFDQIDRRASRSAQHIQREMIRALDVGAHSAGGFRTAEANGIAMARRLRQEMRSIWNNPTGGGSRPPGTPPRTSRPRPAGDDAAALAARQARLNRFIDNQQQTAGMARWSVQDPQRYQRRMSELNDIRSRHMATGDTASAAGEVRRTMFAHRQELASATRNLTNSANKAGAGLMELAAKLYAAGKVAELFMYTMQVGMARQSANNQFNSSFGSQAPQMKSQILDIAKQFGVPIVDALQQASTLRATMSRGKVSDDTIASLFQEEAVAQHSLGLTPEKIGALNNALSQSIGAGKVLAGDMNQMIQHMPEVVSVIAKGLGKDPDKTTRKDLLGMDSVDLLNGLIKGLQMVNKAGDAYNKTANAMSTKLVTMQQEMGTAADSVFHGYESGVGDLLQSFTNFFQSIGLEAHGLGVFIGDFARDVSGAINWIADMVDRLNAWLAGLRIAYRQADEDTKNFIKALGETMERAAEIILGVLAAKLAIAPITAAMGGLNALAGAGGAGAAGALEAGAVRGLVSTILPWVLPIVMAAAAAYAVEPVVDAGLNSMFGDNDWFQNIRSAKDWKTFGKSIIGDYHGEWQGEGKDRRWHEFTPEELAQKQRKVNEMSAEARKYAVTDTSVVAGKNVMQIPQGQLNKAAGQPQKPTEVVVKLDQTIRSDDGRILLDHVKTMLAGANERQVVNATSLPGKVTGSGGYPSSGFTPDMLNRRPPVSPSAIK